MQGLEKSTEVTAVQSMPSTYRRPTTGIAGLLPDSWVPYFELGRFHKPTGIYLFFFPHLFGVLYASTQISPPEPWKMLKVAALFFGGTVFMRSAACAWNDYCDIDYDRKVKRCRLRPLARDALTPWQGLLFAISQTVLAATFLLLLPRAVGVLAIPSIGLLWLYPFCKRFTDFPQVVLGIQVAWGYLLGLKSIGYEHTNFFSLAGNDTRAIWAFYTAYALWTVIYDTIYAFQDVKDDAEAGVKSIAVRFQGVAKPLLATAAFVIVVCLLCAGLLTAMSSVYYVVTCGGVAVSSVYYVVTCGGVAVALGMNVWLVDLESPADCLWWFSSGFWFVGLSVSGGLGAEYLMAQT